VNARTRLILAIAGAVLVVLLAFFLAIRPRQTELADVKIQVAAEEDRRLQLQADLDRLRALQQNEPQLRADLERIRALVPPEHEVPNFIFQVNQAANASGVEFVQITPELPKRPPEAAELAEVRIAIGGNGGYFAIQDFVRRLYALDRAVRVDILTIGADETQPGAALTMTVRIFFEVPGGVTSTVPTSPTTTPTTAPAPSPAVTEPAPSPAASPS
jgi:Tfp pilus assembly protein PilO